MRLELMIGYSGATMQLPLETILEAERLGYHAVWTAEAYGSARRPARSAWARRSCRCRRARQP
jgi:alkanesulfonate monooxygenase SsuD/methylene tetrahydromethanopterin reductase-like flavin-dependent oxidoreductase (luciferase family)